MSSLTADSALQSSLAQAKEITEILGPDGKLLGYFTPAALANQIPLTRLASLFDPEELRRRMASTETGHTIEQVMEHLRSME
jgi:hypothetical protein